MLLTRQILIAAAITLSLWLAPAAMAQDSGAAAPQGSKLSDGNLSREELARYVLMAKTQLIELTESALSDVKTDLESNGLVSPSATMILDDGTVKQLNLREEAGNAPYALQLVMYRTALKSMARHGKISAAAILYSGGSATEQGAKALIIEYEHRLGVSGVKLVPYLLENGKVSYGEMKEKNKPFQLFYDPREDQLANDGGA